MFGQSKKLTQAKLQQNQQNNYFIRDRIKNCLESVFLVFHFILKNPLENFWWECISIIIQYIDMFLYLTNKTVSIIIQDNF